MGDYSLSISTVSSILFLDNNDSGPFQLTNLGSNVIYLNSSPQVNPTDGVVLNIGATLSWAKGVALYAKTAVGSGTLGVSSSGTNLFDPAAIAARINAVGVPIVDNPTQVIAQSQTVASGAIPVSSSITNISQYQTVYIQVSDPGATNNTNIRTYSLKWYADAAGVLLLAQDDFDLAQFAGIAQLVRPVRGAYLQISATSTVSTTSNILTWNVIGSYRLQAVKTILKSGKNNVSATVQAGTDVYKGLLRASFSVGAGSSVTDYYDMQHGSCTLSYRTTSTPSGTLAIDLRDFAGNSFFAAAFTSGAPSGFAYPDFVIPAQPLSITITNLTAAALTADVFIISLLA